MSEISEFVYRLKYARYNKEEKRRETWEECVDRYMDMHLKKFGEKEAPYIEEVREAIKDKRILPSMRGLQFGGLAIEEKNMRLYNCTSSYADRPRFFAEALWLLLCGSGVGFSVQKVHTEKLPYIVQPRGEVLFVVEDSIEGWSDAVNSLFNAYMKAEPYPLFDYSKIRPEGAPLRHGGYAPSHRPLKHALENIDKILKQSLGKKLRPIQVFDCVMFLANCTTTAGTRRSATIALFDADDEEMKTAKTKKDWWVEHPQRARANISAVILEDTKQETFNELFESSKNYGEPAFVFLKSKFFCVNPCVEITMCPLLIKKDGITVEEYTLDLLDPTKRKTHESQGYTFESGWSVCNLTTVNVSKADNRKQFYKAVSLAARLGTYQASYTKTDYLGDVSQEIIEREALLGVSLCGMTSRPTLAFDEDIQYSAGLFADCENKKTAYRIGIKQASRTTCVKPEGTASLVLNTSSGIHPHHSPKYLRRIQVSEKEDVFLHFRKTNPQAVEKSQWGSDFTVVFALEGEGETKDTLNAISLLNRARLTARNWIEAGTSNPQRLEGASHNVSLTVNVKPEEWEQVKEYLWTNREHFTGVSLLSHTGDYDYVQPPLQKVCEPDEENEHFEAMKEAAELWKRLKETVKPVDYNTLIEEEDKTKPLESQACAGGQCELR